MTKLRSVSKDDVRIGYSFYCPGCLRAHVYYVPQWTFNGDVDRPSFTPSLRVFIPRHVDPETKVEVAEKTICHLHLTLGVIHFCNDCVHPLNGQSCALPEFPFG